MELSNKKDYFMHKHECHFSQNIEKTELSSFSFRILKLNIDLVAGGQGWSQDFELRGATLKKSLRLFFKFFILIMSF